MTVQYTDVVIYTELYSKHSQYLIQQISCQSLRSLTQPASLIGTL